MKITPQQAIKVSVALQEMKPMPPGIRCGFGSVRLMPLEDWGARLERSQPVVKVSNDRVTLSPEAIDGLAPAEYGVSVEGLEECFVADNPVLDLTKVLAGSVEASMRQSGVVKGFAETGSEVILIPGGFFGRMVISAGKLVRRTTLWRRTAFSSTGDFSRWWPLSSACPYCGHGYRGPFRIQVRAGGKLSDRSVAPQGLRLTGEQ